MPSQEVRVVAQFTVKPADRMRFAMVEAWESEAALAKHLAQPSLQAGLAKLAPMAAGTPSLLRLRPV